MLVGRSPVKRTGALMRLKLSKNSAEERLVALLTDGHALRTRIWQDYSGRKNAGSYQADIDVPRYRDMLAEWLGRSRDDLQTIFPTALEEHTFLAPKSHSASDWEGMDEQFGHLFHQRMPMYLERLKIILDVDLRRYTDRPVKDRLYVEDVDSFRQVRDVNPAVITHCLRGGFLALSEDEVQLALEQILDVPFHKKDWGGETDDL